jgi:hypothetical protein
MVPPPLPIYLQISFVTWLEDVLDFELRMGCREGRGDGDDMNRIKSFTLDIYHFQS